MAITIKEARQKLGLTQQKMANLLGMAQPTLARIETGGREETKGHIAHLTALELLEDHGLIDDLTTKIIEGLKC